MLVVTGDDGWRHLFFEHQVQAGVVHVDGLVGVVAAGVLDGVGVDGELVHLPVEDGVAVLLRKNLRVDAPAFGGGVVVPIVGGALICWEIEATAGTRRGSL